jgi:hypothetical protein
MTDQDRAFELLRFICKCKLEYPEKLSAWIAFEELLMEQIKHATNAELVESCDFIADIIADFLKGNL